jgi:hypothetical protein
VLLVAVSPAEESDGATALVTSTPRVERSDLGRGQREPDDIAPSMLASLAWATRFTQR